MSETARLCSSLSNASRTQGDTRSRESLVLEKPSTSRPVSCACTSEAPRDVLLASPGAGIFFFWQLGAMHYLEEHYDLQGIRLCGASAGALLSVLTACAVTSKARSRCL